MKRELSPVLASGQREPEFHTHNVPAIMRVPPGISEAARRVIARLHRFPKLWEKLDDELQDFAAKKAHGTITIALAESYGDVKDEPDVTVTRKVRLGDP